tara:strand:- start:336 stop:1997 length:1662 start_codon:yes stop_codon:yes gene_type:complete
MPKPPLDRRTFLLASGAVPAAYALGKGDDPSDMAAFGRLAGLEFTDKERAQAEAQLAKLRNDYQNLRQPKINFEMSPSTHFDPQPMGVPRAAATKRTNVTIPMDVAMPKSDHDLAFATVLELASLLRQGKVTSRKLTELCLTRLERFDAELFCVVNLLRDAALAQADERDKELAAGTDRGPLHGIPYGAKDLFAWPGAPTTFGAAPYKDQVWDIKATPLQRLEAAGAVLCAKLSLGALAMGDLWHGGRTRNPYNPEQGSSGSSAGSASAVAAGLLPFALGTETLGSIVSPCGRCGVGGLRPTFGAVSRYGAMPLSWTMDKVGAIARSAIDAGIVFDAMRGADGKDPSARDTALQWQPGRDLSKLRIGILKMRGWPRSDEDKAFVAWLENLTGKAVEVSLPAAPYRSMLVMLHAEAAAAFDQLTRSGGDDQLPGQRANDWPNQFRSARTIPAVEYIQASRLRQQLVQDMHKSLANIDVLVAPTHGGPTLTATNLTGHPTYVVPVAKSTRERDGGRPRLLALVGQLDGEGPLLEVAEAWQRSTEWHRARPTLTNK